jgi:hypothetical protein
VGFWTGWRDKPVNAFVVSGLVKRRAESAGEIERDSRSPAADGSRCDAQRRGPAFQISP